MKYLFILGNHPDLSIAEIHAYFREKAKISQIVNDVALVEVEEFRPEDVIRRLGGTIKIAEVLEELPVFELEKAVAWAESFLVNNRRPAFGISIYGKAEVKEPVLAMEIKKSLKAVGLSSRWVSSKDKTLSSVVITQNKLIEEGAEIIIAGTNPVLLARTLVVQAFKELSQRDYGRPARDDKSGMLPPKLAQIMLNLAHFDSNKLLLDPFCGSGTVLCEATLAGAERVIGSDLSAKAINDTKKNLAYYKKSFDLEFISELYALDVLKIKEKVAPDSLDCIVFEGYLGPQRGAVDWKKEFIKLNELYQNMLPHLFKLLSPGGRLVMALPSVRQANANLSIVLNYDGWEKPHLLPTTEKIKPLLYGREGQRVWRELFVLEKINPLHK